MNTSADAPYEYTVGQKKTAALTLKRVALIACYVLWAAGLLLLGIKIKLIVPLLALVPLSLWILVFLTWRWTQIEYEFSCFAGTLTVSRILGGRSRRTLAEITLRNLISLRPCDEESSARAESQATRRAVFALSSTDADGIYVALWSDGDDRRVLYFEPTDKALRIIRSANFSAVSGAK